MSLDHATATRSPSAEAATARKVIPLAQRRLDLLFIAFFLVNLCFITYIVDLEQLVIANPAHFTYPLWPPAPLVDLVHSYGNALDPLQVARPVWWKMTIWIDVLGFGPFYAFATYAFIRGRDWIRIPTVFWAGLMVANVTIILGEEFAGPHATPYPLIVFLLNLPWLLFPLAAVARVARADHPFTTAP